MDLNRLTASAAARLIAAGEISSEAVVEACLARILEREASVHAWAFLDPDRARESARKLDRSPPRGPLHGVPIAVKDIIDTSDMPTAMGSPIYAGNRPLGDAACVAAVRNAGAVIFGKTVTAEFASSAPNQTVNPFKAGHTPGGSSSGSAAAVGGFMVPAAFGTQTGGSVLRPSAYCGVIGFKPTFGLVNLTGIKPAAQSLDTLGLHARSLDDIELLTAVLLGRAPQPLPVPDAPPKIGLCRTPLWQHALPETVAAIDEAAAAIAAAGCRVVEIELPSEFQELDDERVKIHTYERSRALAFEWTHHKDRLGVRLRDEIERGLAVTVEAYVAALQRGTVFRHLIDEVMAPFDAVLGPTADGAAPAGLATTGNPRFQAFWTILRLPTLTLPTHMAPDGLPVGIQLIGHRYREQALLGVAEWVWQAVGRTPASIQAVPGRQSKP
jgi:Asp-tRNA(Asn)/Glu-tRNA(Gln) amidotransferase A subunit family amidase